ncbi:hypothetical protein JCM6882_001241 [Rhodosporidiobolus microsporus]
MSDASTSSHSTSTRAGGGGGAVVSGGSDDGREDEGQYKEDSEGQNVELNEFEEPVKKKARKGKGKSRMPKRDVGKLSSFVSMPLDILAEIAGHLDPLTLLHMSRANKAFRAVFASPRSKPIWHAARRNIDLMDLEADDLSEMAYAALMFEKVCHVCGKDRAQIVNFDIRRRFCKACQRANLDADYWVSTKHKDLVLHPYLFECCLSTTKTANKNKSGSNHFFTADLRAMNDKLHTIQSRIALNNPDYKPSAASFPGFKPFCTSPPVPEGQAEFKPEERELEAFVEQRRALIASAHADAEELEQWVKDGAAGRGKAAEESKRKRLEAIHEKLESLGYDKQERPKVAKVIDQPRVLTEAIWKRIAPTIIENVEENRDARLVREQQRRRAQAKNALRQRFFGLRGATLDLTTFPSFETFVNLPAVTPLWEADPAPVVDDALWATVAGQALEEAKAAMHSFKVRLAQFVSRAVDDTPSKFDASIKSKLSGPLEDGGDGTISMADDELVQLFQQYRYHLTCGNCDHFSFLGVHLRDLTSLAAHVDSYGHPLAGAPAGDEAAWCTPGWAEVAVAALKLVGLPADANGSEAVAKLNELGERWACGGCSGFSTLLERENNFRALAHGQGPRSGLRWTTMVDHIFHGHLRAASPTQPTLKFSAPPAVDAARDDPLFGPNQLDDLDSNSSDAGH